MDNKTEFKASFMADNGYVVATKDRILVFDYYHDPTHALKHALNANPEATVVFFSTGVKERNFNPDIFDLAQNHRRVYVMSNIVKAQNIPTSMDVAGMSHGDIIDEVAPGISVRAYGKSDDGLAFYVKLNELTFLHAGTDENLEYALKHIAIDGLQADYVLNAATEGEHLKVGQRLEANRI